MCLLMCLVPESVCVPYFSGPPADHAAAGDGAGGAAAVRR